MRVHLGVDVDGLAERVHGGVDPGQVDRAAGDSGRVGERVVEKHVPRNASAWLPPKGVVLSRVRFSSVKSLASTLKFDRQQLKLSCTGMACRAQMSVAFAELSVLLFAYWITVPDCDCPLTVMSGLTGATQSSSV